MGSASATVKSTLRTPILLAGDIVVCQQFSLPSRTLDAWFGWLQMLTWQETWFNEGDPGEATPAEMVELFTSILDAAITGDDRMLGKVYFTTAAEIDTNELICDGSTLYRVDYPDLYEKIDPVYKLDANRLRLPNMIDRFPLGAFVPGTQGGESEHTLTIAEMPSHHHAYVNHVLTAVDNLGETPGFAEQAPVSEDTSDVGGGNPHNNMPPYEGIKPVIVAVPCGASLPDVAQYVLDLFDDSTGTELADHVPNKDKVGGGWISEGFCSGGVDSATTIDNNQALLNTVFAGAVIDSGLSSCKVYYTWIASNDGPDNRMNFYFRWKNNTETMMLFFRPLTNQIVIRSLEAGCITTDRVTAAYTITPGQAYDIRLELIGANIVAYVNDVSVLSLASALFQTETRHGFHSGNGTANQRLTRFEVRTL